MQQKQLVRFGHLLPATMRIIDANSLKQPAFVDEADQ
jgi:hypothetical protein